MEKIDILINLGIELYKAMSNYETYQNKKYKDIITKILTKERQIVESMNADEVCDYLATYYEDDEELYEIEYDDPFEELATQRLYRLMQMVDKSFDAQQDCSLLNIKELRELDNKIKFEVLTIYNHYQQVKINIEHNLTKEKPYNEFINRYNNSFLYNDAEDLYSKEITIIDHLDPEEDYEIIDLLIYDLSNVYAKLISRKDNRIERIDEFKAILNYIPKECASRLYMGLEEITNTIRRHNPAEVEKIVNYIDSLGYKEYKDKELSLPAKYKLRENLLLENPIYYDNNDMKELDKEFKPLYEVSELILNLDKELLNTTSKKDIEMIKSLLEKYLKEEEYYLKKVKHPNQLINYITFQYPLNITTPKLLATSSINLGKNTLDRKYKDALISLRVKNNLTKISIDKSFDDLDDDYIEDDEVVIKYPKNKEDDNYKYKKAVNLLIKLNSKQITQEEFNEEITKIDLDSDKSQRLYPDDKYILYTNFMMNYIKKISESIERVNELDDVINKKEFKYYLSKSKVLLTFINTFERNLIFNNNMLEELFKYEDIGDEELANSCSYYLKMILKNQERLTDKEVYENSSISSRLERQLLIDYKLSSIVLLNDKDLEEVKNTTNLTDEKVMVIIKQKRNK